MDLLKRFGLLLLTATFVFLGLYFGLLRLLQDKDSGVIAYIVQDILFILSGIIGVIACSRALSKMRKDKIALSAVQPLPEIICAGISWKYKLLAALLLLFTIACIYGSTKSWPDTESTLILASLGSLLGFFLYIFYTQFDRDGETLRLDNAGIKHIWYGRVPWNEIVGISMQTMVNRGVTTHVLYLGLIDRSRYLINVPWLVRKMSGFSMSPKSKMALNIPLHMLNVEANIIEKVANNLRSKYQPPMAIGWHYSMTETEFKALQEVNAKFQALDDELLYFDKNFDPDKVLTDLEIAELNSKMEAILTSRFKAVNEVLDSNKIKSKNANQTVTIFITIGFLLLGVQLYSFYLKAGSSWLFGVIAVMLVIAAATIGWKFYKLRKNTSH